jgi:hypothetical protein
MALILSIFFILNARSNHPDCGCSRLVKRTSDRLNHASATGRLFTAVQLPGVVFPFLETVNVLQRTWFGTGVGSNGTEWQRTHFVPLP